MGQEMRQAVTPVAETFRRLSQELQDVSGLLGQMHAPVEAETWKLLVKDRAMVSALQNIDRVEQTLNAVSMFLQGISKECDPAWALDIAEYVNKITLTQLRDRLDPGFAETHSATSSNGDIDFF